MTSVVSLTVVSLTNAVIEVTDGKRFSIGGVRSRGVRCQFDLEVMGAQRLRQTTTLVAYENGIEIGSARIVRGEIAWLVRRWLE
jgi:hypothetical protein